MPRPARMAKTPHVYALSVRLSAGFFPALVREALSLKGHLSVRRSDNRVVHEASY